MVSCNFGDLIFSVRKREGRAEKERVIYFSVLYYTTSLAPLSLSRFAFDYFCFWADFLLALSVKLAISYQFTQGEREGKGRVRGSKMQTRLLAVISFAHKCVRLWTSDWCAWSNTKACFRLPRDIEQTTRVIFLAAFFFTLKECQACNGCNDSWKLVNERHRQTETGRESEAKMQSKVSVTGLHKWTRSKSKEKQKERETRRRRE